jgi:CubicO group peptidase (beta-lactamase class C family)
MKRLINLIPEYKISIILFLSLIILGSSKCFAALQYASPPLELLNDGFDVDSLEKGNIDSVLLQKAVDEINLGKYGEVHSMLIFKDNKIVFEEYFKGHRYKYDGANHHGELISWDKSTLHGVKSVSKSIVSLCIGIAIDKGFIKSVYQSIFDYLPDHQRLNKIGKEKITIEHLLTMTSGLQWDEWGTSLSNEKNDIVGIWFQDKDPLTFILEKPLVHDPGTTFNYSGGNTIILGEIIRNATKMDLDKFSEEYLFKPLEIDSSDWSLRFKNDVIEAGGGLDITPRDMTKIGALCLNNGTFSGKQIISKQWIEKCKTQYANNKNIFIPGHASGSHGYAYSWWLQSYKKSGNEINMYHAVGWGGQEIIILPELNAVVVFTGGNYISISPAFIILDKYILSAIN